MSSLTYLDKKLEHIGWTNKHYYIFVSCSGAVLIDMLWLANMTIIFQWLAGDWGISESQKGLLSSFYLFGMLLSMICGKIADKFGRIWLFRRIPLIKIASGIGLACSQNIIMFIAFLIFLGFGAGADMTIAGTTFKEYIPQSKSWTFTVLLSFMPIGGALSGIISVVILHLNSSISFWRNLCWISISIDVLYLFIRQNVKETPRFLFSNQRYDECKAVLSWVIFIQLSNKNINLKDNLLQRENTSLVKERSGKISELFSKELRFKSILLFSVTANQCIFIIAYSSMAFQFFTPDFFNLVGLTSHDDLMYIALSSFQISGLPGSFLVAWALTKKTGKKYILAVALLLSAFFQFLFYLQTKPAWMIILGCLKSCFVTMGWSVLFTFNAEFFPTYIRSTGIAFGNASARLGGLISPIITGEMMEWSGGPVIVLLMLSMLYLLLSVLSTLFIGDKKKANIEVEIRDV